MKSFIKLNAVACVYAFSIVIPLELMANVYRISRLTNWDIQKVNLFTEATLMLDIIGGTILLFFLTRKWFNGSNVKYWTTILWVPYLVLFIYIIASLFPITYAGDVQNSKTGFFVIGGLIVYPFYILVLNFVETLSRTKSTENR
ncbi:hypothetical protein CEQ21_23825 [Niallia circulans]|uniref:Uncharacterized protein n=1 Tax=Niallia circulans TaxID=1397 RepID=A0A553SN53_NIACI|nr:hypothetical protein [Niallia circulans]TRZ38423.1 hypothetical protein CEQ21_23825 [Niallia circulans]